MAPGDMTIFPDGVLPLVDIAHEVGTQVAGAGKALDDGWSLHPGH